MKKGNHMKYEISGNKMRLLFSLLLVLMVILLVSCSSQSSQKTVGTVSYSADVASIFSQKCTQCHGGRGAQRRRHDDRADDAQHGGSGIPL